MDRLIVLPPWRYNMMERMGMDMSSYAKVEYQPEEKERIVVYLNRESRRKAARSRRRSR